jgi:hypothetical protein
VAHIREGSHHAAQTGSALRMYAKMPIIAVAHRSVRGFLPCPALTRVATGLIAPHLLKSRHDTINIIIISFACSSFCSCHSLILLAAINQGVAAVRPSVFPKWHCGSNRHRRAYRALSYVGHSLNFDSEHNYRNLPTFRPKHN